jgi:NADPH:quinone reductase-like Zn-dependent oxidoreductase
MRAAVVTSFGQPPTYGDIDAPLPRTPNDLQVVVIGSGLHPRVRSQADGSHYTSSGELPLVPGIDGVGRDPDGVLRYFILPDTTMGAMAQQTVIDRRRSVVLPEGSDPILIAAAMNPAMSAWLALRRRVRLEPGQSVLVLGATGNAGQLAVQVAKHLGAGRVVAGGGRAPPLAGLTDLGADATVALGGDPDDAARRLAEAARDVDLVLDYVWGEPTAHAMRALIANRTDPAQPLTWVEVGSIAGPTAALPSAALRAARLQIVGSGQGSVPAQDILAELPELAAEISHGTFRIDARTVPLAEVEAAWRDVHSSQRVVITP